MVVANRKLPESYDAEAYVVQACIADRNAISTAMGLVTESDFATPSFGAAFAAVVELWNLGLDTGWPTVREWLTDEQREPVSDAYRNGSGSSRVVERAREVADAASIRRLMFLCKDTLDRCSATDATITILEDAYDQVSRLYHAGIQMGLKRGPNIEEFLDHIDSPDWIVPGTLEHHERVILVAAEGRGKSFLSRQWAVQISQGIHPIFPSQHIEPYNAMVLDLENGESLVRRKIRPVVVKAKHESVKYDPERLAVICRPEGIDLTTPVDRRWLEETVRVNETRILFVGPLYKMASGKSSDDEAARELAGYLDSLRKRHSLTLFIEHHSPKQTSGMPQRDYNPFGSSVWMRWPEFGLKMVTNPEDTRGQTVFLGHYRGPRDDQRNWPPMLTRGGDWPWTAVWHEGDAPAEEERF